jgi:hypothetical protein
MIRRQVLDVEVEGTQADGLALQRRLRAVCADVLSPALAAELARVDPGDAHLYVERLEISLSGIALDRLESELVDAVRKEVADYFRRHPPVPSGTDRTPATSDVELRTAAWTVGEALVVFLRSGQLPWSFRVPPGTRLEQIVLDAWAATTSEVVIPSATLARFAEVLASRAARTRLLLQFTPAFVSRLLRAWSPRLTTSAEEALAALDEPHKSALAGAAFTRAVWDAALAAAAAGQRPGPADLARAAWESLTAVDGKDRSLAISPSLASLAVLLETRWPGVTETSDAPPAGDEVVPERSRATLPIAVPAEDAGALLVDNAGLVLLHPFMPRFFNSLEIADGDELVEPGRALSLLHHVATGELTAPELQLTLDKVLCDVPLDEPVEADVGLTEAETAEAKALLEAAIHHWEALRATSPDALRGEFLMRPGVLTTDIDDGWLLRVEGRTADILLDQLPWGISMVKLPWMARMMRVEWR